MLFILSFFYSDPQWGEGLKVGHADSFTVFCEESAPPSKGVFNAEYGKHLEGERSFRAYEFAVTYHVHKTVSFARFPVPRGLFASVDSPMAFPMAFSVAFPVALLLSSLSDIVRRTLAPTSTVKPEIEAR